jgi:hypothetical protein
MLQFDNGWDETVAKGWTAGGILSRGLVGESAQMTIRRREDPLTGFGPVSDGMPLMRPRPPASTARIGPAQAESDCRGGASDPPVINHVE